MGDRRPANPGLRFLRFKSPPYFAVVIMKKFLLAILACVLTLAVSAQTYDYQEDYNHARKFSGGKLTNMLFSTQVDPHWTPKGDRFWYAYKTSKGMNWYIVNPSGRTKKPLFNREKLAAQLTLITHDPIVADHLPISGLEAKEDGTFEFYVTTKNELREDTSSAYKPTKGTETFFFSYNPDNQKLTRIENRWKQQVYPSWASFSPDGKTVVFARDFNLYKMSRADYERIKDNAMKNDKSKLSDKKLDSLIVETQLTTFGEKDFGFGMPYSYLNTDTLANGKRKGVRLVWSPDSKHFAVLLEDNRKVKELWVVNSLAQPRPTLETYKYEMPGEKDIPQVHLYVFDVEACTYKEVNTSAFKDQSLSLGYEPRKQTDRDRHELPLTWLGNKKEFFLTRSSRDLHRIDVCKYVLGEDTIRPIIRERMNTYQEVRPLAVINGGKELIHWSERSGWAHLYLYDGDGNLKKQLTEGSYHVMDIVKVDESLKTVYFTANGYYPDENPYYQHLFKVTFGGGAPREITLGDFYHDTYMDDHGRYYVDNYSRVDSQPRSALFSNSGIKIMDLEVADMDMLLAQGYRYPEVFKVKAADGVTDLWGVMYKPFDFDSTKVYPIIDYVYPGPQVEATYYPFTKMSVRTDRLAQAGFIVISVGNRGGHPDRSKWYHNYGYGNLRDYGLADQKAAIEQLANKYSFIDINKVGIHGHSGGGFMSTAAILKYPDFFKVAVSCAGNHDNNIYNRWWSETHHGVKEIVKEDKEDALKNDTTFAYSIATNPQIAKNLKGHLLLVHGDIDNNVHPGNTMRVVDALIRAGKRFDMLMLPQQRHGFGDMNEYFYWRLVDYFSEHLKGYKETMIDIPEL